jgi:acetyl esterase/lipase
MDIYFPSSNSSRPGPSPAILYFPGDAWSGGSKTDDNLVSLYSRTALLSSGFIVAAVDSRRAPQYKFPAQMEDAKCAVRYLRANAATYNIDPDHIGAYGQSTGGLVAVLLGVTDKSQGWDVGEYLNQSSRIQAVVDLYSPIHSGHLGCALHDVCFEVDHYYFDSVNATAAATPLNYISSDDPPFLIIQGENDSSIPPSQSIDFQNALQKGGVTSTLVLVAHAGHGLNPVLGEPDPSIPVLVQNIADFFTKYLRS